MAVDERVAEAHLDIGVHLIRGVEGVLQTVEGAEVVVEPHLFLEGYMEAAVQFLVDCDRDAGTHLGVEVYIGLGCGRERKGDQRQCQGDCFEGFHELGIRN